MRFHFAFLVAVFVPMLQFSDVAATQQIAVTDLGPIVRTGPSVQTAVGHSLTPPRGNADTAFRKEGLDPEEIEEAAPDEDVSLVNTGNAQMVEDNSGTVSERLPSHGPVQARLIKSAESSHASSRSQGRNKSDVGSRQTDSEAFQHSAVGVSTRQSHSKETGHKVSVQDEEEKLRSATIKLVTWLRNRLRKRLNDVATLEGEMQTEKTLLRNLNESIANTTSERENEIRSKIKTQKQLSEFRRNVEEPERQLLAIQTETKKLSDHLARLGEIYNSLAERRRKLREKLHEAGFSHWLDTRGKEYLPDTAIGVLSKSTELLQPFSQGIEQAVNIDRKFAARVERIIPNLSERSLFGRVIEEFLMLLPIIPMLVIMCRLLQTVHTLSILHLVMYEAAGFMFESFLFLLVSAVLGREIISALQEVKHSNLLIAGLFINAVMYFGYMFTQTLISVLQGSRFEMLQTILSVTVGYHYYWSVFRPVMLNERVCVTAIGHLMSTVIFCLVAYEKKRTLQLRAPFEDQINEFVLSFENWTWETIEAMSNVFYVRNSEMDMYSPGSSNTSLSDISSDEADVPRMEKTYMSTAPGINFIGASAPRRGYGRWTGARIVTGVRQHNGRSCDQGQGPTIGQSGSRLRTPFTQSESGCSTVYGSCQE